MYLSYLVSLKKINISLREIRILDLMWTSNKLILLITSSILTLQREILKFDNNY